MVPQQPRAGDAMPPLVLAITGASGTIYAVRLLRRLLASRCHVHLSISPSGAAVLQQELGIAVSLSAFDIDPLVEHRPDWSPQRVEPLDADQRSRLHYHHYQDFMTPIASGSFLTAGMIICPCSGSTLAGIAHASSSNLIQRAAEVHLKERRKLVVVPRETPLSTFALENMHRLSLAGGVVLPAMPGWYHGVTGLDDLVDFMVSRILDQFAIDNTLISRWGQSSGGREQGGGSEQQGGGEPQGGRRDQGAATAGGKADVIGG